MIIGIDEVGRGCWAGPLVAAAVLMDENFNFSKLRNLKLGDSKKLSKKRRVLLAQEIPRFARVGVGWVDAKTIDEVGLTEANRQAMLIAIKQLNCEKVNKIIIDGNINYLKNHLCKDGPCSEISKTESCKDGPCEQCSKIETLVGADGKIAAVSAASIIAKVARDQYMTKQALVYPEYGFEKHVGYGTEQHVEQLTKQGVTPLHRKSYKPVQKVVKAVL